MVDAITSVLVTSLVVGGMLCKGDKPSIIFSIIVSSLANKTPAVLGLPFSQKFNHG